MILDKADRKKTDAELKIEIEELKKMRNKDQNDIRLLKVELGKMTGQFKKFKDSGGFQEMMNVMVANGVQQNQAIIQLPQKYLQQQVFKD